MYVRAIQHAAIFKISTLTPWLLK